MSVSTATPLQRLQLKVRGTVQGVGFRPHCLVLAQRLGVSGWVRNDGGGVELEVQGDAVMLQAFVTALAAEAPPLAQLLSLTQRSLPLQPGESGFVIRSSALPSQQQALLPADAAICQACLAEMLDPADRRYRYPFINCTHCGPRWTIAMALPYDRARTSMAAFEPCVDCAAEYADPQHRRFHAQPNACPRCGPRLRFCDGDGAEQPQADPLAAAVALLRQGQILALHGVGGFHLVCDARRPAAVARLRQRKQRPGKPLAVIALNAESLRQWVSVDAAAEALLRSAAAPLLLLPLLDRHLTSELATALAPGLDEWGVMIASQPLHYVLFQQWLGEHATPGWHARAADALWVMTSANPAGEPLVATPDEALSRLAGIADGYLMHDRPIVARVDDSILRPRPNGAPLCLRRARGYVPQPIELHGVAADAPPMLAAGGWLKNTVCVSRGNEAFVSPHIGDLGSAASCAAHQRAIARLLDFLGVRPQAIAHDLHPDFFSSRHAVSLAQQWQLPVFPLQHHLAHLAALRAEHAIGDDEALHGWILDGSGLGLDGDVWGGELLCLHADGYGERLSHVPALPLAGGDAAAREPWRMAAAVLQQLGMGALIAPRYAHQPAAPTVQGMLQRGLNCPLSSSAGRAFDAASALLGLCERQHYEAEAAMRLEAAAAQALRDGAVPKRQPGATWAQCWTALLAIPTQDAQAVALAALEFHEFLAQWLVERAQACVPQLRRLAIGGGCMNNRLLRDALQRRLRAADIELLEARALPCGDGGLALGQLWLTARRLQKPAPASAAAMRF